MSSERAEIEPNNGGHGASRPAISAWWLLPVIMAWGLCFGALGGLLGLALELPRDSSLGLPAVITVALATASWRPRTFRQLGLFAAAALVAGIFTIICYLPFVLFAQGFEGATQSFMVRMTGMAVAAGCGTAVVFLAFRRLKLPGRAKAPAKDRS